MKTLFFILFGLLLVGFLFAAIIGSILGKGISWLLQHISDDEEVFPTRVQAYKFDRYYS